MSFIQKRGNSFRAMVSVTQHGKRDLLTKTFNSEEEAKIWALRLELDKASGKQIAERNSLFKDFFFSWIVKLSATVRLWRNVLLEEFFCCLILEKFSAYLEQQRSEQTENN